METIRKNNSPANPRLLFAAMFAAAFATALILSSTSYVSSQQALKKAENWRRINWVDEKGVIHTTILSPRPGEIDGGENEAAAAGANEEAAPPPGHSAPSRREAVPAIMTGKVEKALSGDTFLLDDGKKVRYVGIAAPKEGEAHYKSAFDYHRKLVQGKYVNILFDSVQRDEDGALLGLVFVNQMTFVNAELVRRGYAKASPRQPNIKYERLFANLQKRAQSRNLGMWQQ